VSFLLEKTTGAFDGAQSVWNLVCHRSMSGKTCLWLVKKLDLSVIMTGKFYSMFNDVTGKN